MDYECNFCNKKYKRKTHFDKHILLCEITHKCLRHSETITDDRIDIYNTEQLSNLVLILMNKVNNLEKKIEKINIVNKKKINIENWLNENQVFHPTINFDKWIQSIEIDETNINNIIKNDFILGITLLIKPYICEVNIPLKAFDKKVNELYIFNDKWLLMTHKQFDNFINHLSKQILQKGINIVMTNPNLNKDFAINIKKLNGGNFKNDKIHLNIKKAIYDEIKVNIKNIVEYQFI